MQELLESEVADSKAELALLSREYGNNDSNLAEFMGEHPDLFGLLHEAREKIREYFGSDAKVQLDLTADPDDRSSHELFVRIISKLRTKEALHILDRLDEEWWLDASLASHGNMNITVEPA
jgi:hypothetical protein